MSATQSRDNSKTNQRLAALEAQLETTLASTRRKALTLRIVTVLAVGMMGFYFIYAHQQISQFDTETAADVLQANISEALPQASEHISASLKDKAPQVMEDAQARLLAVPHELVGVQLKGFLMHNLGEQILKVEDEVYQTIKVQLDGIKADHVSNRPQPLSEAETAALLDQVLRVYGSEASLVIDKVYNDYANVADELIAYMHKLGRNESLSRREEIHRDLLQTFLALMEQHQKEGGLQWDKIFNNPLEAHVPVN
ncbi:MAG: hypothetical protein HC898_01430 [Phycisphaerales bacterium]|nr:hypothetical protein [Phycisphaerales bacterium]